MFTNIKPFIPIILRCIPQKKSPPRLITHFTSNNEERFAYNNVGALPNQFVKDPIIVVLTPKSTGNNPNSHRFWRDVGVGYTFYQDYDQTKQLLKKYDLYNQIAAITDSQQSYETQVEKLRNEILTMLASSILGVITSAILYNSMSLLYFEEFRREIFIKRMAGMKFGDLHYNYLMLQAGILILGFGITFFITNKLVNCLLTLAVFSLNLLVSLTVQMKKENRFAVMILKGM